METRLISCARFRDRNASLLPPDGIDGGHLSSTRTEAPVWLGYGWLRHGWLRHRWLGIGLMLVVMGTGRGALGVASAPPFLDTVPSVTELKARRSALARAIKDGVLIFEGTAAPNTLRSDRSLYYLTGVAHTEARLIIDVRAGQGTSYLFLLPKNEKKERWDGPSPHPGPAVVQASGIESVLPIDKYESVLSNLERQLSDPDPNADPESPRTELKSRTLYVSKRKRKDPFSTVEESDAALSKEFGEGWTFDDHHAVLARLRQRKSDFERRLLEEAVRSTQRGFEAMVPALRAGVYEFQLEAKIEGTFLAWGSTAPGFESIIGSGPNSCVLHYTKNRRQLNAGELVVVDIGAQSGPYTADITRTFPVDGQYTERQRQVYEWVLEAQRRAIAAVRPGVTFHDLNQVVRRAALEFGCREALLHGVSHHVGLEVHDVWIDPRLAPGMVITVEPGLYFPDENLGVRIEDMVLITEDGCVVLTRDIPKQASDVEAWMKKRG